MYTSPMKRVALLLLVVCGSALAETWSGTLVDVMCKGKDLAGHTRECALACAKSGYGLVTADGKFIKLDETGNAQTMAMLRKSAKEKDLKAKVTGAMDGDTLHVETIELQ